MDTLCAGEKSLDLGCLDAVLGGFSQERKEKITLLLDGESDCIIVSYSGL